MTRSRIASAAVAVFASTLVACSDSSITAPAPAVDVPSIELGVSSCTYTAEQQVAADRLVAQFDETYGATIKLFRHLEDEYVIAKKAGDTKSMSKISARLSSLRAVIVPARNRLNAQLAALCE